MLYYLPETPISYIVSPWPSQSRLRILLTKQSYSSPEGLISAVCVKRESSRCYNKATIITLKVTHSNTCIYRSKFFLHSCCFCSKFSQRFIETTKILKSMTVCSYHVTHAFQSESTLHICLNVKELLAQNLRFKWLQWDSNPQPLSS